MEVGSRLKIPSMGNKPSFAILNGPRRTIPQAAMQKFIPRSHLEET